MNTTSLTLSRILIILVTFSFLMNGQRSTAGDKDQVVGTLKSRVQMLDRVFNRFVKGVAISESNPVNWGSEWWKKFGSEQDWKDAVTEWFTRNPELKERAEKGRANRSKYRDLVSASISQYINTYSSNFESPDSVFNSYVAFLHSQRNLAERERHPLEAQRLAREATERYISGLSVEKRLPFEQWQNDSFIWQHYSRLKTRLELEAVQRDHQRPKKAAFERWKREQLKAMDLVTLNLFKSGLEIIAEQHPDKGPMIEIGGSAKGKTTTRKISREELRTLKIGFDDKGTLVTQELSPRRISLNGVNVSRRNYPTDLMGALTYRPQKDAPTELLKSLEKWSRQLGSIRRDVISAKFDDPPAALMEQLHRDRIDGNNFKSEPMLPNQLGTVSGPKEIAETLTDLVWEQRDPEAWTHFRPKINWPLAPTPADIIQNDRTGNARRALGPIAKLALHTALLTGILTAPFGFSQLGKQSKTDDSENTFHERSWDEHRVRTPGNMSVDMDRTFNMSGTRSAPNNGARHFQVDYNGKGKDESSSEGEDESSKKDIYSLRTNTDLEIWKEDAPTRFELSWVNDPSFGTRKDIVVPNQAPSRFWLDSMMPQRLLSDGRLALPVPEGHDLSSLKVYEKDGTELKAGDDFAVEKSDRGHLALRVTNEESQNQGSVHLTLGYDSADKSLSQAFFDKYFVNLNKTRLKQIAHQMSQAGIFVIGDRLMGLAMQREPVSVHDIEKVVKGSSLYSSYPEGKPKPDPTNPFWFVSSALNTDGIICGDCDVVNEVTAVIFDEYFRDQPEVLVERGILFVRDPYSDVISTPLHGQLYLRPKNEIGKLVLDSTPTDRDPRDSKQGNLILPDRAQSKNHLSDRKKPNEEKESSKPNYLPAENGAKASFSAFNVPSMPYNHRFRFRGQLPEEYLKGLGPEPTNKVRRRIMDPDTEKMLSHLKTAKSTLSLALEASGAKGAKGERLPQHAVFELVTRLEDYVDGKVSLQELKAAALRWAPANEGDRLQNSSFQEIITSVHDSIASTLEKGSKAARDLKLSKQYEYLTDPSIQSLILSPLRESSKIEWKPVAWEELEITDREVGTRKKCGQLLELLADGT